MFTSGSRAGFIRFLLMASGTRSCADGHTRLTDQRAHLVPLHRSLCLQALWREWLKAVASWDWLSTKWRERETFAVSRERGAYSRRIL